MAERQTERDTTLCCVSNEQMHGTLGIGGVSS
jgi:hypothetical protein